MHQPRHRPEKEKNKINLTADENAKFGSKEQVHNPDKCVIQAVAPFDHNP